MGDDRARRLEWVLLTGGVLAFVLVSWTGITQFPLPWWDEGWTLSVAKNWVMHGHYGHMINGLPAGPTLSAHLPVVSIVAASFLIFGAGLAQARMAIIVCAAVTLVLLYVLTRQIVSRRAAVITLLLVCLLPLQWDLSILIISRNVLGEIPALMFILSGLTILLHSRGTRPLLLLLSSVMFGIALATKAQVVPFLVLGLGLSCVLLILRDRPLGLKMIGVLGLSMLTMYAVNFFRSIVLVTPGSSVDRIVGLTDVTAVVFDKDIRIATLRFALMTGGMLTLALGMGLFRVAGLFRPSQPMPWPEVVRSILVVTAGSWYGWFALMSIGWGRYGFPSFVLAAPFAAELVLLLYGLFRGDHASPSGRRARFAVRLAAPCLLLFFTVMAGRQMWFGVQALREPMPESGLDDVSKYVNTETPAGATVETYDSELLFLLDRPVHVPPAQVNVSLLRRNYLKGPQSFGYDLEQVHAEFLILGAFGTGLYDPLVERGTYVQVYRSGVYTVYRRSGERR